MTSQDVVFLFDVDNTLVDNDRIQDDLRKHLERESGPESRDRYWAVFEQLRDELGYADYLGALQRYRLGAMNDTRLSTISISIRASEMSLHPPFWSVCQGGAENDRQPRA